MIVPRGTIMKAIPCSLIFAMSCFAACVGLVGDCGPPSVSASGSTSAPISTTAEADRPRLRTIDGLDRIEVGVPGFEGILEVRPDHRIGAYDALLLASPSLGYRRHSMRLTTDGEAVFLALLQQSLVDAIRASRVSTVEGPERCAMEIELEVIRMDLDTGAQAGELAEMTIIMHFRDSMSGTPLLRYAKRNTVPHPDRGVTDDLQIRAGLDRIVRDMNIATVLRPAGLADDSKVEGCEGTLADRGPEAPPPR